MSFVALFTLVNLLAQLHGSGLKFDCLVKVNAQQFCETIDYCVVELNPMIFVFANGIWISATSLACFKSNGDQTARGEKPVARRQWLD